MGQAAPRRTALKGVLGTAVAAVAALAGAGRATAQNACTRNYDWPDGCPCTIANRGSCASGYCATNADPGDDANVGVCGRRPATRACHELRAALPRLRRRTER